MFEVINALHRIGNYIIMYFHASETYPSISDLKQLECYPDAFEKNDIGGTQVGVRVQAVKDLIEQPESTTGENDKAICTAILLLAKQF